MSLVFFKNCSYKKISVSGQIQLPFSLFSLWIILLSGYTGIILGQFVELIK